MCECVSVCVCVCVCEREGDGCISVGELVSCPERLVP